MPYSIEMQQTGGTDILTSVEHSVPRATPGTLLIRNHAAGVNYVDALVRKGEVPPNMMPDLPHVLGIEGAGVIEALGDGVMGFCVGDRVAWTGPIGAGGYSSHSVIGCSYVSKLADGVDFVSAAAIPVNAMTAYHMLVNLGGAAAEKSVLIHAAAGGVGTMAQQIAKHLRMTVIGSASTAKIDYVKDQGADYTIDYRTENVADRVKEITDGRGVDLILNPVSGETTKFDLDVLAPLGTLVIFGFLAGPPAGTFAEELASHFTKSVAVRVSDLQTYLHNAPKAFNADMKTVFGLLGDGILRPNVSVFSIKEAGKAHQLLESGETTGKLVLQLAS